MWMCKYHLFARNKIVCHYWQNRSSFGISWAGEGGHLTIMKRYLIVFSVLTNSECVVIVRLCNENTDVQGPVAQRLVSANRWLRGIKTYRFPWYLTLVSANHASSNPGQDVMNSNQKNQKFDISLDGTTNQNAFVLTLAVRICWVRALKEREYQLPVAIFAVRDVNVLVA